MRQLDLFNDAPKGIIPPALLERAILKDGEAAPPGSVVIGRGEIHTRGDGSAGVHLRIAQQRPGLTEGVDYPVHVACLSGAYHLRYTDDHATVTCPLCLKSL